MLRFLDLVFASTGLIIMSPLLFIVTILGFFDTGSPIFFQTRVGKNKKPFTLIKFRTMPVNTESVATHLISRSSITKFGIILRKTKIDELPQLINVLRGDMTLVGPRPNLFNQTELIQERTRRDIYDVQPGMTGLAQINRVDMATPKILAETDQQMLEAFTVKNYFKYIILTAIGKGLGDRIILTSPSNNESGKLN